MVDTRHPCGGASRIPVYDNSTVHETISHPNRCGDGKCLNYTSLRNFHRHPHSFVSLTYVLTSNGAKMYQELRQ